MSCIDMVYIMHSIYDMLNLLLFLLYILPLLRLIDANKRSNVALIYIYYS